MPLDELSTRRTRRRRTTRYLHGGGIAPGPLFTALVMIDGKPHIVEHGPTKLTATEIALQMARVSADETTDAKHITIEVAVGP
ncbi:MAG TPA: hypothetical protein VNY31_10475 [Solirubrobacteraceae bacterium]|jgi:hypothetical protein|nr:hypothetical protein [Solirubrobacteraceae bacterium]